MPIARHTVAVLSLLMACNGEPSADDTALDTAATDAGSSELLQVDIALSDADWGALTIQGTRFLEHLTGPECLDAPFTKNYEWYPATVTLDGLTMGEIGVRKKGFLGSNSWTRPSLKLDADRFVDGNRFDDGREHVTLNNMQQDPSRIRTCLAYAVFTRAGLPAPDCSFAEVRVQGQEVGVYADVQPVKKRYLTEHFGNDNGDLYEGTVSDFTDDYVVTFEPKTDETDAALTPLYDLADALEASDDDLLEVLGGLVDIDAFLTFWVVESLIGHWDGYSQNRNNFYVYRSPDTGLMTFLPWGADAVFMSAESDPVHTVGALASRLWNHPVTRAAYLAEAQRLLDEVWDEAWLLDEVNRMGALVSPHVRDAGAFEVTQGVTRAFIADRRAVVQAMITSGGPERPYAPEPKTCIEAFGSVEAAFDLTWTSLEDDPFDAPASLGLAINEDDIPFIATGSLAGTDGSSNLLLVTSLDPTASSLTYALIFLPPTITPGTYDLDLSRVVGVMATLEFDSGATEPTPWGYIVGEVDFEAVGIGPNQQIRGSLTGQVVPLLF